VRAEIGCGASASSFRRFPHACLPPFPDAAARLAGHDAGVGTYAITWRDRGGPVYVGKLELVPDGLRLEGGSRSGRRISVVKLRYADVSRVEMALVPDRLAKQPTIDVSVPRGRLYIAPSGPGVAREVLELLRPVAGRGGPRAIYRDAQILVEEERAIFVKAGVGHRPSATGP
jgi:hypothetical protein